ncbi:hypothetical protein ACES2J_08335 [Bdellovibrio bacteriovorus]|uniref:C1q-like domain-containing protein n=1 Tax=Bdellovibrio bacteriovorus TaxID=959 RepID=UPI0035A65B45
MATTISLAGVNYSIPSEGDGNYAADLTAYFIALANNTKVFQVSSANFPLQQETSFGASYGLKVAYVKSQATNPSGTGILRMGNNESVGWRNAGNTADLSLKVNSSDVLEFNGTSISVGGSPVQPQMSVSDTSTIDLTLSSNNISGLVKSDSLSNSHINSAAAIAYSKLALTGSIVNSDLSASAAIALSKLATVTASRALVSDASGYVSASSVTTTELGYLSGVTSSVQTQLTTNATGIADHLADSSDAHDASAISSIPAGNLAATDVQAALNELQTDIDTRATSSALTAHTGASAGVHGVTGAVVGTTDSQVLTNKDIDGGTATNASRLTIPKAAKSTLDALTRKQGTILYDTTSNKPYYDDGANLKVIGSGSGGSVNFISNGDAETGTTGWATYADAAGTRPVDGTGGTANVTFATSATDPLVGSNSFIFTKDAVNRQGQGASYDFTIDNAYKAKVLSIEMDYVVNSGTFVAGSSTTDSDVIVYIYDVTNSILIEPSSFKFLSNSGSVSDRFSATFQTASNSTSYRLILHCASTSASAFSLKIDGIAVSPSKYVYGTPISEWTSYTPTVAASSGALTNYNIFAFWRRVGDSLELKGVLTFTGAPGTWSYPSFTLPPGLAADANYARDFSPAKIVLGDVSSNSYVGIVSIGTTTQFSIYSMSSTSGGYGGLTQTSPFAWTSGDYIGWGIQGIKIQGWGASTQMSDNAETRVVAARAFMSSNQALTGSFSVVQFNAAQFDTHAAYNTGSYRYIVPTSGYYNVKAKFLGPATSTNDVLSVIVVHSGTTVAQDRFFKPATITERVSGTAVATVYANAGDYFEIQAALTPSGSMAGGSANNFITVEKIAGPSSIAATETVAVRATNSSAQSIPSGTTTVLTGWTKIDDTHGAFNATTGVFTAPEAGFYAVAYEGLFASSGWSASGANVYVSIINPATSIQTYRRVTASFSSPVPISAGSLAIKLNAGQQIYVAINQDNGTARSLDGGSAFQHLSIHKVK